MEVWVDQDSSTYSDQGEDVLYRIVVSNDGTVTLQDIVLTDTSGYVFYSDAVPSEFLDVGQWYECMAIRKVRGRVFVLYGYGVRP